MPEKQSRRSSQTYAETRADHRRRRLIGDDEAVSEAVVAAVATAADSEVESLPPLGDELDIEALDRLISSESPSLAAGLVFTRTEDIPVEVEVSFEYADYDVTVSNNYVVLE